MTTNAQTITAFFQAWADRDLESIINHFTDDAVYTNIPMGPPNVGKANIREFISRFLEAATEIEFIVHKQVEGPDGVIMNERTDKLTFAGKSFELPVMGVLEISDGKICAWRDYFDMGLFNS